MPLANRATIGNMSPEYGSTVAIFPVDDETVRYLKMTGRDDEQVALVEAYAKAQGLWHDPAAEPAYSETIALDLATVVPSIAGPKRPQDRVSLSDAKASFRGALSDYVSDDDESEVDEAVAETFPASDPISIGHGNGKSGAPHTPHDSPDGRRASNPATVTPRRHDRRDRPRRRRHRRDHVVHQHVQPDRDDRRGAASRRRRSRRA